ncbi:MAG: hypothetical protein ACP5NC_06505 [Nitrososphaeria archaeon]
MIKYNMKLFVSAFSLRIISFFFQATLPLILVYFDISSINSYWYFILLLWIFGALGSLYSILLINKKIVFISFLTLIMMAIVLIFDIKMLMLVSIYIIFMMVSAFSVSAGSGSYVEGSAYKGITAYSAGLAFGLAFAILAQLLFFNLKNIYIISVTVLILIVLTALFYPFRTHDLSENWSISKIKNLLFSKITSVNVIENTAGSLAWPFAITFLGVYAYKFLNFPLSMVSVAFLISVLTSALVRSFLYISHRMPDTLIQKFSIILYGISLILSVTFRQSDIFLLSMFILGLAHGLYFPTMLFKFLSNSSDKLMGYLVYNASFGASEMLSSVIGGIMVSQLNYINGIFGFSVFFLTLNIIIFLVEARKGSVF